MLRFITKRLVSIGLSLLLISTLLFFLLHCADAQMVPNIDISSVGSLQTDIDAEALAFREAYQLDQPIFPRFLAWMSRCLRLDFGDSMQSPRSVLDIIGGSLTRTIGLQGAALLLIFGLGIPLGAYLARSPGSMVDRIAAVFLNAAYAMPSFWLGTCLLVFLATDQGLALFPLEKLSSDEAPWGLAWLDRLYHLVLPTLTLSLPLMALVARQTRQAMLAVLDEDFIRNARATGIAESTIHWRYALRHALLPAIMILGSLIPSLVGGSIVVERIFNIQGLGYLLWESVLERDFPVLQGLLFITTLAVLLGYLLADLLAAAVDPRLRCS